MTGCDKGFNEVQLSFIQCLGIILNSNRVRVDPRFPLDFIGCHELQWSSKGCHWLPFSSISFYWHSLGCHRDGHNSLQWVLFKIAIFRYTLNLVKIKKKNLKLYINEKLKKNNMRDSCHKMYKLL